ncbi:hypothetical protein CSUB01_11454 [Colletotrichum sublineola]|uniref:Uncharacterized protein n=1 Tax=Colletotrichum sublineola TaxID=1173701 RepID=A0A066X3Z9_COLSU|nr:hypothetical protein CSUB01_11454 [Colletotrichum sublineola]
MRPENKESLNTLATGDDPRRDAAWILAAEESSGTWQHGTILVEFLDMVDGDVYVRPRQEGAAIDRLILLMYRAPVHSLGPLIFLLFLLPQNPSPKSITTLPTPDYLRQAPSPDVLCPEKAPEHRPGPILLALLHGPLGERTGSVLADRLLDRPLHWSPVPRLIPCDDLPRRPWPPDHADQPEPPTPPARLRRCGLGEGAWRGRERAVDAPAARVVAEVDQGLSLQSGCRGGGDLGGSFMKDREAVGVLQPQRRPSRRRGPGAYRGTRKALGMAGRFGRGFQGEDRNAFDVSLFSRGQWTWLTYGTKPFGFLFRRRPSLVFLRSDLGACMVKVFKERRARALASSCLPTLGPGNSRT